MVTTSQPTSQSSFEAGILQRILLTGFEDLSGEFARRLAAIEIPAEDAERVNVLSAKARAGTLSATEDAELEAYLRVGHTLSILRLRARSELRKSQKKSRTGSKSNGNKSRAVRS